MTLLLSIGLITGLLQERPTLQIQPQRFDDVPRLEFNQDPYMRPPFAVSSPRRLVASGRFNSVQVNVDALGNNTVGDAANEPSIGISPADPSAIVIGWRQFDNIASNFRQAGWGYSHDTGATWTAGVINPGVFRSDPVLDADTSGKIYYNSLAVVGSNFHCDTYVSSDGGVTWSGPNFSFGGDKAWFTVDKTGGLGHGHLHQAWSTAGNSYFPNQFNRSTDGSATWISPVEIQPIRQVWGTVTVDADSNLYVAGQRGGAIHVSKSTNAKLAAVTPTFDFTVTVPFGGSFRSSAGPNPGGLLGQVWVAADHSDGPTSDNVYLLSSINPPGADPLDVFFARSEDGGLTWSPPVRVNDDPAGANSWQWFGTMSVAPNGRIDAIWNDTRDSGQANLSQTFYSYSLDGGRTWSTNISMTPTWDSLIGWPNQSKIGDYYDMISDSTGAGLAYSATFNGEQDVYYLRIEPEPPIMPQSFSLHRGTLLSGGLSDLFASDDSRVAAQPGITLTSAESPLQMIVTGTATTSSPLELGFLLESRVSTPGISEKIELFNYDTGLWEQVDARPATTGESITHVLISTNPERFIETTTQQIRARVSYKQSGITLHFPWTVQIDRANWTITQ